MNAIMDMLLLSAVKFYNSSLAMSYVPNRALLQHSGRFVKCVSSLSVWQPGGRSRHEQMSPLSPIAQKLGLVTVATSSLPWIGLLAIT